MGEIYSKERMKKAMPKIRRLMKKYLTKEEMDDFAKWNANELELHTMCLRIAMSQKILKRKSALNQFFPQFTNLSVAEIANDILTNCQKYLLQENKHKKSK